MIFSTTSIGPSGARSRPSSAPSDEAPKRPRQAGSGPNDNCSRGIRGGLQSYLHGQFESPPACSGGSELPVSARSFERFGASVVEVFELEWREVIDRAVRAGGVEPLHPRRGRDLDLIDVAPRALVMGELGLVEPDLGGDCPRP